MISWRKLEKELIALSCVFIRQTGSHRLFRHPNYGRFITVATHSKTISRFTYQEIMKRVMT